MLKMSSNITNNEVVEESVGDDDSVSSDSVYKNSVQSDSFKSSEHKSGTEHHSDIKSNNNFNVAESGLQGMLIIGLPII